jgi:hypothetical protein
MDAGVFDSATIYGDRVQIDIEPSAELTDASIYGNYIFIDNDSGEDADIYGIYLHTGSNVDYGIYQISGIARNYFAGDVGVGTDDPELTAHFYSGSTQRTLLLETSDTTGKQLVLADVNTTNYAKNMIGSVGDDMAFYTNGQERLRINDIGNVGIGTDGPSYEFEVTDTNDAASLAFDVNNQDTVLRFDKAGSTKWAFWNDDSYSDVGSDVLRISGDGGLNDNKMVILQTGNVGIGTDSPVSTLDVNGNVYVNRVGVEQILLDASDQDDALVETYGHRLWLSSNYGQIRFRDQDLDNTTTQYVGINYGQADTYGSIITGSGDLVINPASGNVGIGTTDIDFHSLYNGIRTPSSIFMWNDGSNPWIGIGSNLEYGSDGTWRYINSDEASLFYMNNNGSFRFDTASTGTAGDAATLTNAFQIENDGDGRFYEKLGIGTTPSRILHVKDDAPYVRIQDTAEGSAAAEYIEFYDSNTLQGSIGFLSTVSNNLYINNSESGGDIYYRTNAGIHDFDANVYTRVNFFADNHVYVDYNADGNGYVVFGYSVGDGEYILRPSASNDIEIYAGGTQIWEADGDTATFKLLTNLETESNDILLETGRLYLDSTDTYIDEFGTGMKLANPLGYITQDIVTDGIASISSDENQFSFNKPLYVNSTAVSMNGHTHTEFASSSHNHNDVYSLLGHTHTEYASNTHSHDSFGELTVEGYLHLDDDLWISDADIWGLPALNIRSTTISLHSPTINLNPSGYLQVNGITSFTGEIDLSSANGITVTNGIITSVD